MRWIILELSLAALSALLTLTGSPMWGLGFAFASAGTSYPAMKWLSNWK